MNRFAAFIFALSLAFVVTIAQTSPAKTAASSERMLKALPRATIPNRNSEN